MECTIPDVIPLGPKVFGDDREFFFQSFNPKGFEVAIDWSVTFYYAPEHERCIAWNETIGIKWTVDGASVHSAKDWKGTSLARQGMSHDGSITLPIHAVTHSVRELSCYAARRSKGTMMFPARRRNS